MIVDVVAVHAEVEGIDTDEGILIFLEVIGVHDDVVAAVDEEACIFIVCQDRVCDAGVLIAIDQGDAVAAVVIDGEAVDVDFIDALGEDAVAAFLIARDAEIADLDPPEAGFRIRVEGRRPDDERRFAFFIEVLDVGGST